MAIFLLKKYIMDISVIVPAYNEEKYIKKCLKSIKGQKTKLDYELIVSDCKSTDRTLKIAKRYADKIVIDDKKGAFCARNKGVLLAKDKILIFVDADTEVHSDYLESAWKKFNSDSSLAGLSYSFKFSKQTPALIFAEEITNDYLRMKSGLGRATLPGFNTCVLKDKFEKIGGFKDFLLEDTEFSRELLHIGKTEYSSEVKVVTSSRKLERMGLLGTLRYYFELNLIENNIDLRGSNFRPPFKIFRRIKNKIFQKALKNKTYKCIR